MTGPTTAASQIRAGHAALARGDADMAVTHFDHAIRLAPANIPYRLGLAIAYDHAEQNAAALGVYRQVLALISDQDEPSGLPLPIGSIRDRVTYLENMLNPLVTDKLPSSSYIFKI